MRVFRPVHPIQGNESRARSCWRSAPFGRRALSFVHTVSQQGRRGRRSVGKTPLHDLRRYPGHRDTTVAGGLGRGRAGAVVGRDLVGTKSGAGVHRTRAASPSLSPCLRSGWRSRLNGGGNPIIRPCDSRRRVRARRPCTATVSPASASAAAFRECLNTATCPPAGTDGRLGPVQTLPKEGISEGGTRL